MSDIVKALREGMGLVTEQEAADEIERLRKRIAKLEKVEETVEELGKTRLYDEKWMSLWRKAEAAAKAYRDLEGGGDE